MHDMTFNLAEFSTAWFLNQLTSVLNDLSQSDFYRRDLCGNGKIKHNLKQNTKIENLLPT